MWKLRAALGEFCAGGMLYAKRFNTEIASED